MSQVWDALYPSVCLLIAQDTCEEIQQHVHPLLCLNGNPTSTIGAVVDSSQLFNYGVKQLKDFIVGEYVGPLTEYFNFTTICSFLD
jgi:hypothetical protein